MGFGRRSRVGRFKIREGVRVRPYRDSDRDRDRDRAIIGLGQGLDQNLTAADDYTGRVRVAYSV